MLAQDPSLLGLHQLVEQYVLIAKLCTLLSFLAHAVQYLNIL
jgi:hypothetical protein